MRPPVRGFRPQQPRGAADPSATRPAFINKPGSESNSPEYRDVPHHDLTRSAVHDRRPVRAANHGVSFRHGSKLDFGHFGPVEGPRAGAQRAGGGAPSKPTRAIRPRAIRPRATAAR